MIKSGLWEIQPGADYQQHIRILLGKVGAALPDAARTTDVKRMIIRDQVHCLPSGQYREVQRFRELQTSLAGRRRAHTIPDEQSGPACLAQHGDEAMRGG